MIEETADCRTPDIVLAEIARKYLREGVEEEEIEKRLSVVSAATTVTWVDSKVALLAGKAYLELLERSRKENLQRPSVFDAIVLATAMAYNAKVVTGDEHFKSLPETIWI